MKSQGEYFFAQYSAIPLMEKGVYMKLKTIQALLLSFFLFHSDANTSAIMAGLLDVRIENKENLIAFRKRAGTERR